VRLLAAVCEECGFCRAGRIQSGIRGVLFNEDRNSDRIIQLRGRRSMPEEAERPINLDAIRAAIYGDAFSDATRKSGNSLLIVAAIALVAVLYNITPVSTSAVPFDFSKHPDSLKSVLAFANIILLVNYALRAINDVSRTRTDWAIVQGEMQRESVRRSLEEAQETDQQILGQDPNQEDDMDPDPWWERYIEESARAKGVIKRLRDKIDNTNRRFVALMWFRLVWFGAFPLLAGVLALVHSWKHAGHFAGCVVGLACR
jgi:hypothetical protein